MVHHVRMAILERKILLRSVRSEAGKWLAAVVIAPLALGSSAFALEPKKDEAKVLADCDRRLCTMLLRKEHTGDDLKCDLTKTWARSTIKGADSPSLKWSFGDAQCSVHLHIARASIVAALTAKEYKLWVPAHTAECIIEQNGEVTTIKATLAPKLEFKGGKVEKVWINLLNIEGTSAVTALLSAAASLEDSTGLFHGAMVKGANKYIYVQCPKNYPTALAGQPPKVKDKKPASTAVSSPPTTSK
jgi:hypothetical protein